MQTKKMTIKTYERNQILNITKTVSDIVDKSGVKNGLCNVYIKHTSASITVNENDDPKIQEDFITSLSDLIPRGIWEHDKSGRCDRQNGDAHIKSFMIGHSETIPVENGQLTLGKWQSIFLCEFDGPREREIIVTIWQ